MKVAIIEFKNKHDVPYYNPSSIYIKNELKNHATISIINVYDYKDNLNYIFNENFDIIFIPLSPYIDIDKIKCIKNKAKVILISRLSGDTDIFSDIVMKYNEIDYIFNGEVDGIAYNLCSEILSNNITEDINKHLTYREHLISIPRFSSITSQEIIKDISDYDINSLTIETSRGCRYRGCNFCYLKQPYTERNIEDVIKEIKYYDNIYSFQNVSLYDSDIKIDNLITLINTCAKTFYTFLSIKEDPKKIKCLTGHYIYFGIESLQNDILRLMNKKQTFIQILQALIQARSHKVNILLEFLLLGVPFETQEMIDSLTSNLNLIKYLNIKFSCVDIVVSKNTNYGKMNGLNINYNSTDIPERARWQESNTFMKGHPIKRIETFNIPKKTLKLNKYIKYNKLFDAVAENNLNNSLLLYMELINDILYIYDKRSTHKVFILKNDYKDMILSCEFIKNENEIKPEIAIFLQNNRLLYKENGKVISLPVLV